MPRYAARIDENQPDIVEALTKVGSTVVSLAALGHGKPDILVGHDGRTYLFEIKNPKTSYGRKGLTRRQLDFSETWRGAPVLKIRSIAEALVAIGVVPQGNVVS